MRPAILALIGAAGLLVAAVAPQGRWSWPLPSHVAPPQVPEDNPMNAAKVALGRRLFYDADLSVDGTMSCASCHSQRHGFADSNRTRPGVHGEPGRRNVPGLANIGWLNPLTSADPHLTTLEAQFLIPVLGEHPIEMGMKGGEAEIMRRLDHDPCYVRMFAAAFRETGGRIDMGTIARAIAAFERTMISYDTPYDRSLRGDAAAMPQDAREGATLFGEHCASCHAGPNLTDTAYHAIEPAGGADRGLIEKTGRVEDDGRFRTPSLRNVMLSAPYFHDGASPTIEAAIRRHRLALPDGAIGPLLSFLGQLTDSRFIADKRLAMPDKACGRRL